MKRTVTIPVEFELGTLDEIWLGGFKTTWLEATDKGREYSLTAGAGVGSPYLEGSVQAEGQPSVYARADIRHLAQNLFDALTSEQTAQRIRPDIEEAEARLASDKPMETIEQTGMQDDDHPSN